MGATETFLTWVREAGLPCETGGRRGEWVVTLPGEAKLRTVVSVIISQKALSVSAFVIRRPDENHEACFRWLLAKNSRLPGVAFCVDRLGDIYLMGRIPSSGVDPDSLDNLMGAVLSAADGAFNELLALGFITSMRQEWAWRVSRGESLANLEAFRQILEDRSS